MASPAQRQHPFWDLVPLEGVALVAALLAVAVASLLGADDVLYERVLAAVGKNAPATRVAVVRVDPEELRSGECSRELAALAARARAVAALVTDPLAQLCPGSEGNRKLERVARSTLRASGVRVIGIGHPGERDGPFSFAGDRETRWIAPRPWRAVPSVSLDDLASRRVPETLLRGRALVFALDDPDHAGKAVDAGPPGTELGAAVAAVLEDRPRRAAPTPAALVLAALLCAAIWASRKRPRLRWAPAWLPWAVLGVFAAGFASGAYGFGWLLPLPSLILSAAVFVGIADLPTIIAARRARTGASRLLEAATSVGSHASHLLPDGEFWARMARRVEQTHPADGVLVAELPPFSWRLRVWPNGDLNESIIRERRRDVRRTPYVDEAGTRRAKIVDGFVVMSGTPVVFAPLEAAGELEGFLILIGKPAAHAFVERPQGTLKLADELALLIRNRRLERLRADEWRRPVGMLVENPGTWSETLLEKARTATGDLGLLNDVFRAAPVGLLYADPFGDVRMLGATFAELLRPLGVSLPDVGEKAALPPGRSSLAKLLTELAALGGGVAPSLSDITPDGLSFELGSERADERLRITLKRLGAGEQPSGFLATLERIPRAHAGDAPDAVQRLPERGDPLVVFSLAELVTDAVSAIARDSRMKLRFQTPRVTGHAIGHRKELTDALVAFLMDAVASQPGGLGPVVTMRERRQWVELTIMDLKLDVPEPAMERTVLAPSVPPPGLEPLARFIQAVEDSHGYARVRGGTTWGVKVTIGLVRAHPRFESGALGRLIRISEAPLGKRK